MSFSQSSVSGEQVSGASWSGAGSGSVNSIRPARIASAEAFGTAFLQSDRIAPALVPSGESFGTESVVQIINLDPESEIIPSAEQFYVPLLAANQDISPALIASAESFNPPGFSKNLGPEYIETDEAFFKPTMVSAVVTGEPGSIYRFYINDVLVNGYILRKRKPVTISHEAGSFGLCRLTWYDPTGTTRPERDQELVIVDTASSNARVFGGLITKTRERFYSGTTAMEIDVTASGWGLYLERRVSNKVYTTFYGDVPDILLANLIRDLNYNVDTGLSVKVHNVQGQLGVFESYCQKYSEAVRKIMQASNMDYFVTPYKIIQVFTSAAGWEAAPFGFADDDGNFLTMFVERDSSLRANKVFVKNSRPLRALWTDSWAGDEFGGTNAGMSFPTQYFLSTKPIVRVNDVDQVVTEVGDYSTPGWQWYYIPDGTGVFRNWALSPLGFGDTIDIVYPSPLQYVYIAQDADSIAADGEWDAIVEGKDLPGYDEMEALGNAYLDRSMVNVVNLEATTVRSGLLPGQLLTVATTQPLLSDNLLIKSVNGTMIDGKYILWSVKATNSEMQKPDTWKKYLAEMLQKDRQPVPRGRYSIHIEIATDIPGITNPGLTARVIPGARTIERSGYVAYWKAGWEDGTPFDENIYFDIRFDGTSIFPEDLPCYPADTTGVVTGYTFVTANVIAAVGTKVTAEITSPAALATAMNGWIDLVIDG